MIQSVLEIAQEVVLATYSTEGEVTITLPPYDREQGYYEQLALLAALESQCQTERETIMNAMFNG